MLPNKIQLDDTLAKHVRGLKWERKGATYINDDGMALERYVYLLRNPYGAVGQHIGFKNGNASDYRIENLTPLESKDAVKTAVVLPRSGYKNVCYYKPTGKWVATFYREGERYRVGTFADPAKAAKAIVKMKRGMWPEEL